ncbi:UDP-N-acetylglucosamine 1-carboxyvinyltransferase 2 [Kroppenstedtia guangzhouensis]|uniref:UDP-N-acetylglucosamine 1-carboxyvinyltransferase n=1 Tax=Kroppenstedtia guangzhouensis TaxID=1274356 RepID=A0ABQ1GM99_9BACL|nr:UDP-N-acetylglucosamine 1-carboxyvinyltransferase [Kroppenstedtia guangzhouensis]GGA46026.1 UDP-N-acetylglucosamine 1-carboxyvinyltransferase 2 [Kroppenstedtia guangzhouensis]
MEKLMIKGGRPLYGHVPISGAKNSALALIPATILAESVTVIENLPGIRDVQVFEEILRRLGAEVIRDGDTLRIDGRQLRNLPMDDSSVKKLRASYYLMGAMLGRFGEAVVGMPGGCNLGPRPIDQHIKGFEALGAQVVYKDGSIHLTASHLKGARIYLDVISVGATINIMLAASRAEGVTVIENAAKEPEIIDVATLLSSMGARIKGAGTDVIRIRGKRSLQGCRHSIIPDRIEAGTYMIAAAATVGDVTVENVIPLHLEPLSAKLREMGITVKESDESLRVIGKENYQAVDIKTLPYPGFPTDLQQPFTSLLIQAEGTSLVTDNIYVSRFKHVDELYRMGADIRVEGRTARIRGGSSLHGATVRATDLRGGAALVVAGLAATGVTEIIGVDHIDRGYENLEKKLCSLGAEIWRV